MGCPLLPAKPYAPFSAYGVTSGFDLDALPRCRPNIFGIPGCFSADFPPDNRVYFSANVQQDAADQV
ncbi:MAG: hypothetical protein IJK23_08020 [Clostridia bacterium]|nr:hypothetical protein [Clostridia bacterium]